MRRHLCQLGGVQATGRGRRICPLLHGQRQEGPGKLLTDMEIEGPFLVGEDQTHLKDKAPKTEALLASNTNPEAPSPPADPPDLDHGLSTANQPGHLLLSMLPPLSSQGHLQSFNLGSSSSRATTPDPTQNTVSHLSPGPLTTQASLRVEEDVQLPLLSHAQIPPQQPRLRMKTTNLTLMLSTSPWPPRHNTKSVRLPRTWFQHILLVLSTQSTDHPLTLVLLIVSSLLSIEQSYPSPTSHCVWRHTQYIRRS